MRINRHTRNKKRIRIGNSNYVIDQNKLLYKTSIPTNFLKLNHQFKNFIWCLKLESLFFNPFSKLCLSMRKFMCTLRRSSTVSRNRTILARFSQITCGRWKIRKWYSQLANFSQTFLRVILHFGNAYVKN